MASSVSPPIVFAGTAHSIERWEQRERRETYRGREGEGLRIREERKRHTHIQRQREPT